MVEFPSQLHITHGVFLVESKSLIKRLGRNGISMVALSFASSEESGFEGISTGVGALDHFGSIFSPK